MTIPQFGLERYIGANVPIANADGITFTELIRVAIPALPGWVELTGKISLQAATAGQQASIIAGVLPVGGNIFNMLDGGGFNLVGAASGANAEPEGRAGRFTAWLQPNSPGDYMLAATRKTGANAANMLGTSLIPSYLAWERKS